MTLPNETRCSVDLGITVDRVDVTVRRYKIRNPVTTSFGTMTSRPAVFLRVTDSSGAVGYGEVWCNFPACGAEHRARLVETEIVPRALKRSFADPAACLAHLSESTRTLALQSGETGPLAQCLAGLDVALWDLAATRAGLPLYRLLGGRSAKVKAYASGINPDGVAGTIARARANGHTHFKLKIGFGEETDFRNMEIVRSALRPDEGFMVDANQAWPLDVAVERLARLADYGPGWVEEPMRVDARATDWQRLAQLGHAPLAGGENFADRSAFDSAIAGNWLTVIQPDLCKWGGLSLGLPLARDIIGAGKVFCPHSLGGGVALAASAHLLAAAGGNGLLEVDANPNPLREDIFPVKPEFGEVELPPHPGLGVEGEIIAAFFR